MKKLITATLCFALVCVSSSISANEMSEYKSDTEELWRTGSGAQDGAFSALSLSMIGWGIGLTAGIAILCCVLHQSTASTAHTTSTQCH